MDIDGYRDEELIDEDRVARIMSIGDQTPYSGIYSFHRDALIPMVHYFGEMGVLPMNDKNSIVYQFPIGRVVLDMTRRKIKFEELPNCDAEGLIKIINEREATV